MSGQEGRAVERDRPGPTGTWMVAKSAPQTACAGGNPIGAAAGHVRRRRRARVAPATRVLACLLPSAAAAGNLHVRVVLSHCRVLGAGGRRALL